MRGWWEGGRKRTRRRSIGGVESAEEKRKTETGHRCRGAEMGKYAPITLKVNVWLRQSHLCTASGSTLFMGSQTQACKCWCSRDKGLYVLKIEGNKTTCLVAVWILLAIASVQVLAYTVACLRSTGPDIYLKSGKIWRCLMWSIN